MRIVDCHVHMRAEADPDSMLRRMDAVGIDRIIVLSEPERLSLPQTRAKLLRTKRLIDAAPDRISGLARMDNPRIPGIRGLAQEALEMGFSGFKIIPDHWKVYEPEIEPFWETLDALRAPVLFHTGILWGNDDGSRFCRPVYLEKLMNYPHIRFAMAHIGWPWCEECLAVMGRMQAVARQHGLPWQSYIDLTPGTPPHIRKQAVANALAYCGPDHLLFGTDCNTDLAEYQAEVLESDRRLLQELGLSAEDMQRIFAGTADELFPAVRS